MLRTGKSEIKERHLLQKLPILESEGPSVKVERLISIAKDKGAEEKRMDALGELSTIAHSDPAQIIPHLDDLKPCAFETEEAIRIKTLEIYEIVAHYGQKDIIKFLLDLLNRKRRKKTSWKLEEHINKMIDAVLTRPGKGTVEKQLVELALDHNKHPLLRIAAMDSFRTRSGLAMVNAYLEWGGEERLERELGADFVIGETQEPKDELGELYRRKSEEAVRDAVDRFGDIMEAALAEKNKIVQAYLFRFASLLPARAKGEIPHLGEIAPLALNKSENGGVRKAALGFLWLPVARDRSILPVDNALEVVFDSKDDTEIRCSLLGMLHGVIPKTDDPLVGNRLVDIVMNPREPKKIRKASVELLGWMASKDIAPVPLNRLAEAAFDPNGRTPTRRDALEFFGSARSDRILSYLEPHLFELLELSFGPSKKAPLREPATRAFDGMLTQREITPECAEKIFHAEVKALLGKDYESLPKIGKEGLHKWKVTRIIHLLPSFNENDDTREMFKAIYGIETDPTIVDKGAAFRKWRRERPYNEGVKEHFVDIPVYEKVFERDKIADILRNFNTEMRTIFDQLFDYYHLGEIGRTAIEAGEAFRALEGHKRERINSVIEALRQDCMAEMKNELRNIDFLKRAMDAAKEKHIVEKIGALDRREGYDALKSKVGEIFASQGKDIGLLNAIEKEIELKDYTEFAEHRWKGRAKELTAAFGSIVNLLVENKELSREELLELVTGPLKNISTSKLEGAADVLAALSKEMDNASEKMPTHYQILHCMNAVLGDCK